MTQLLVRLAAPDDAPVVRRLQERFVAELSDPLGVPEDGHGLSEVVVVAAADERGERVVGMISVLPASSAPFMFERALPDVWERLDALAATGQSDVRRDHLVEIDWLYIEPEYRGKHLGLTLWTGASLVAYYRKYATCILLANEAVLSYMGDTARATGISACLGHGRYDLVLLVPAEGVALALENIRRLRARNPDIVWRLPWPLDGGDVGQP